MTKSNESLKTWYKCRHPRAEIEEDKPTDWR